jgi:hypothetical protein
MLRLQGPVVSTAVLLVLAVGALPGSGQDSGEDYTKVDPEKLGLKPVPAKKDPATGFVVGGKNATDLIKKLPSLAGRKIAALEKAMRPGAASRAGFLGKDEKLLDVLAADNDFVVDVMGLTHQELARPMRLFGAIAQKHGVNLPRGKGYEFTYNGRKYKVSAVLARGFQESPFEDGTKTNCNATVWNLTNGKKVEYSLLVPEMIVRYGFYEGKGTPYRVEPRAVLEVFDFLKKDKKR